MAFSRVHEIEIDSTYRLNGSLSSTDFEYQLPFAFPTLNPSNIRLVDFYVPNSFWNIPDSTITIAGGFSGTIIVRGGNHTVQSFNTMIAAAIAAAGATVSSNFSLVLNTFTKRTELTNNSTAGAITLTASNNNFIFSLLGFTQAAQGVSAAAVGPPIVPSVTVSASVYSLGLEDYNRLFVRINSFENKVVLPNVYNTFLTYALPLNTLNSKDVFYMPPADTSQRVAVSSAHMRTNTILKIQLVNRRGDIVDLQGRNWVVVLRIEPLNYMDT